MSLHNAAAAPVVNNLIDIRKEADGGGCYEYPAIPVDCCLLPGRSQVRSCTGKYLL
jgi:hypothetical protein